MAKILVIDDDRAIRNTLKDILGNDEGHDVEVAENGKVGLAKAKAQPFDIILCDIKMPEMDGLELLDALREEGINSSIIMISGHGDISTAVQTTLAGAIGFITKPPQLNDLLAAVAKALEKKPINTTVKRTKKTDDQIRMIGESEAIQQVRNLIEKVAKTDARVLITGPNGTGKEVVARLIHAQSQRADAPLIEVNCAAIPSELIESELFGHVKGSFTGAIKDKAGKFEQADGGTLFLDEIGDMSLSAQAKVLRALQENEVTRVGGDKTIKVDVRVIAATNKDLPTEIKEGRFREDLFHRLSVIPVKVPALDERKDDIPLLINYFNEQICEEQGFTLKTFSEDAIKVLMERTWPGNVRELHNVVERLIILSGPEVTKDDALLYASLPQ